MEEKLTLRDQFAMAALTAIVNREQNFPLWQKVFEKKSVAMCRAEDSYIYADAMLEARKKEANNAPKC